MAIIPDSVKELFLNDSISIKHRKNFKLSFFDKLLPEPDLYPSSAVFPSNNEQTLVIENDKIVTESLKIIESLSSSEDLVFGSCESSQLEIMVADVDYDVTGAEFTLTVDINNNDVLLGSYIVKSFIRQSNRRIRKITAYDRMIFFNTDVAGWYKDLSFPITLKKFRDSLCDYIGVVQESITLPLDSMIVEKTLDPQVLSGLDVLKTICEVNGCFGHINRTGNLQYIFVGSFDDSSNGEQIEKYKSPATYEDYVVSGITGLTIKNEDGDIGVSAGKAGNTYTISENFLLFGKSATDLSQIANTILGKISGKTYRPAKIECNFRPWLDVGASIDFNTNDGKIKTFVMKREISGMQRMRDAIEATGYQAREDTFGINTEILQLKGKAAFLTKNAEEISAKLIDVEKNVEAQFKVTAEQISSTVKRLSEAESSIKQTAEKIELKVSKGEISSALSLESDKVTLTSNRLIVDSTNFKLDGNGNASFSGNITAGATITGATMRAGFIDGTEIDIGTFHVSNDVIKLGDFYSLNDDNGVFRSQDKNIIIQADGGELGSGAKIRVRDGDVIFGSGYSLLELYRYVHGGGWEPCNRYTCNSDGCDETDCSRYTCSLGDDGPCEGEGTIDPCEGHCFSNECGPYSCGAGDNECHCDGSYCGGDCGGDCSGKCGSVCSDGCGPGDRG